MFNIGSGELLVLLLLGLLVLGPERLPKAMGQVGRWVAQMRKLSSGFQDEIKRAMDPHDAPFRPGEERLPPANVADEVRVVGVDPPADEDAGDDGDEPPLRMPEDTESETGADTAAIASVPFAPAPDPGAPGPGDVTEAEGADETEGAGEAGEADGVSPETGNVTPLRGHDDGDARAAG